MLSQLRFKRQTPFERWDLSLDASVDFSQGDAVFNVAEQHVGNCNFAETDAQANHFSKLIQGSSDCCAELFPHQWVGIPVP